MSQVFTAHKTIHVLASNPHPPRTEYRVAWGEENWSDQIVRGTKVQMVYNGRVGGRLSPTFPDNTPDKAAVLRALEMLEAGQGVSSKLEKLFIYTDSIPVGQVIDDEYMDRVEEITHEYHINSQPQAAISNPVSVVHQKTIELGIDKKNEFRHVAFVYEVTL